MKPSSIPTCGNDRQGRQHGHRVRFPHPVRSQGCLAIGEGGPEVAKAMLDKTYELKYPEVVGIYLTGSIKPWVGPMDVALT